MGIRAGFPSLHFHSALAADICVTSSPIRRVLLGPEYQFRDLGFTSQSGLYSIRTLQPYQLPHLRTKTPPLMSACCITGRSSPGELRTPTSPYGRQPQRIMAGSIACALSAVTSGWLRTYLAKGPVHCSRTLSPLGDSISSRGVVHSLRCLCVQDRRQGDVQGASDPMSGSAVGIPDDLSLPQRPRSSER